MSLPPQLHKISDTIWELPVTYKEGMRVPARIIASESLLADMEAGVFDQATNVACLPGIINYSYCMPDGHKDVDVVARATEEAGLSRRVVKLVPIGNIKG